MRAIKNLLQEVQLVDDYADPAWPPVWGAEVLGRAIGHELRYELTANEYKPHISFGDLIDRELLSAELVGHHIADVL
jgi:hypothetical protein